MKIKEVRGDTKERIKDSVKDKVTQAGIKTKDKVIHETGEKVQQTISPKKDKRQSSQSPESYASEQVSDTAEKTAEEAVSIAERAVVKGISTGRRKIQEKRTEKKEQAASKQTDIPVDSSEPIPSEQIPELTAEGNAPDVIANQNTGTTLCTEVKASENIVKQKPENIENKTGDGSLSCSQIRIGDLICCDEISVFLFIEDQFFVTRTLLLVSKNI